MRKVYSGDVPVVCSTSSGPHQDGQHPRLPDEEGAQEAAASEPTGGGERDAGKDPHRSGSAARAQRCVRGLWRQHHRFWVHFVGRGCCRVPTGPGNVLEFEMKNSGPGKVLEFRSFDESPGKLLEFAPFCILEDFFSRGGMPPDPPSNILKNVVGLCTCFLLEQ